MLEGLNSAAAGMAAQQQRIDAVANDLANANTTGYKHVRVGFSDLVYTQTGRSSALGPQTGSGARAVDAGRGFAQGALQRTDQPFDVAIQGDGFIRVRLADGRRALTRDGSLRLDGKGQLVTSSGTRVQPAIAIPAGTTASQVSIGPDGTVYAVALSFDAIGEGGGVIAASTSSDGGSSWSDPVVVHGPSPESGIFDDKETITADPTRPGVAYATWSALKFPVRKRRSIPFSAITKG